MMIKIDKPIKWAMILLLATNLSACHNDSKPKGDSIDQKIESLLGQMTLEEKIGQMSQADPGMIGNENDIKKAVRDGRIGSFLNYFGAAKVNELQRIAMEESRLKIPLLIGRDVIHGYRTIFPIPLGMAASWNPAIVEKAYRISSIEAASQGIRWTFAPMIDITWDPRWGRIAEGCGEDPVLASAMAKAMVTGIQGNYPTDATALAACAKHFVGYGFAEAGRDYATTHIPEPLLRDVVLKPFKAAKDAGAMTFMSAFNDLNGVPTSGNEFTLRKILRQEWNYDGMVVSDWGSVEEMINHGYAADRKEAAHKALRAGVDMEMAGTTYAENIKTLLDEGKITQQTIDQAVRNILRVKYKLGLFENPYVDEKLQEKILSPEFLDHARKVARESAVLLKNKNKTLPLSEKSGKVAIIGPLADAPRDQLGTWVFDGQAENSVTPLTAISEMIGKERVYHAKGVAYSRDKRKDGFQAALQAARQSDAVLFFAGEEWVLSGEGQSRGEISLPGAQKELIQALKATGKPLVVVVMAGRPLAIAEELEAADALLYAFHGGTMAGPALADLIFGKAKPSGKLPITFVKGAGQIPFYYYHKNSGRPSSNTSWTPIDSISVDNPQNSLGYKSHHLDYGFTPLLPFGFGLSYTTFDYHSLWLSTNTLTGNETLTVKAMVTNSGDCDADEIVQLYVRDRVGSLTRPVKELKGFRKLTLKARETVEVTFDLTAADLSFFNGEAEVTEPGAFDIWIGPNSEEGVKGVFNYQQ